MEGKGLASWTREASPAAPLLASRGQQREANNSLKNRSRRTDRGDTLQCLLSPQPFPPSLLRTGVKPTSDPGEGDNSH